MAATRLLSRSLKATWWRGVTGCGFRRDGTSKPQYGGSSVLSNRFCLVGVQHFVYCRRVVKLAKNETVHSFFGGPTRHGSIKPPKPLAKTGRLTTFITSAFL